MLRVERIDHGICAMEDAHLVRRLVEEQVPLTVYPLSNVRLRAVPELAERPILAMVDAGPLVSVNSDDPAYFGGYVDDNDAALAAQLRQDSGRLADLAASSVRSSFVDPARKNELLSEVQARQAS